MASASGIRMGKVFVEIGADPAKFFKALGGINKSIGTFGKNVAVAGAKLSALGAGMAAPILASAHSFAQIGSTLYDMSQRTGVAAESLSVLRFAAEQSGTDMESLETSLKKMQKAIFGASQGSKEAADALGLVGLSASDLVGLPADKQMAKIADGLMAIEDPGARAAVAMKIFGKSGTAIIPMLEGGSAGMDRFARQAAKLGLVMDSETAAKADALGDAFDALSSAVKMAFVQIGSAVAPVITDVATILSEMTAGVSKFIVKNQQLVSYLLKGAVATMAIGAAMIGLGVTIKAASIGMSGIGTAIGAIGTSLSAILSPLRLLGSGINALGAAAPKIAATMSAGFVSVSTSLAGMASLAAGQGVAAFSALGGAAARFGASALTAAQATFPVFFTGFNRAMAAGEGFFAASYRGFRGMVMASAGFRTALSAIANSGFARFTSDIVYGLQLTYKTFTWWASGVIARLTAYMGATAAAAVASATNAVKSGAAWVASALPGVMTFVSGAVGGIAAYLGSCAVAVAGSVASAAAVAAAWLAPVAPILAIGAAMVGAGVLAYQFGGQLKSALSGVGELVGQAAGAIGGGFNAAVSDGMIVLGDLATTAQTTFSGVYAAIAEGDLSGAMDILWAGLYAGWLRGVEALMSVVDPWISMFQNAFTIMGAEIYKGWDWLWTNVSSAFTTVGAVIQGAMDNVINGVLASWDTLEAGIRKSWNYIQSFFRKGFDLKKENEKVTNEMDARKRKRELERPGVEGRTKEAKKKNAQAEQDRKDRASEIDASTQATVDGREAENRRRADQRRADTQAAEGKLAGMTHGKKEQRVMNDQFTRLLKDIDGATSMDALRNMYEEFDALSSNGRLTSGQMATLETALEDAQERISKSTSSMGGSPSPGDQIRGGAGAAAGDTAQSKSEVAGTFSSMALGGMGFGSSLAQKQLDALKKIEENTRLGDEGAVAA